MGKAGDQLKAFFSVNFGFEFLLATVMIRLSLVKCRLV
jgi:hypothetical protein